MSKSNDISEVSAQRQPSPEEMTSHVKGGMKVLQMASIGRIISIIVHEINNPLQAIQGGSALALEELEDQEAVKTYLELIQSESNRVLKLTNVLRSIYSPNEPNREEISIKNTIDEAILLIKDDINSKGINFDLVIENDLPSVKMSRHQAFIVLLNLFLNLNEAISATGHKQLRLNVYHRKELIHLVFSVDFPVTLDLSAMQASPRRMIDIYLAERIVDAYGGSITLTHEGQNSHLSVQVPLEAKEAKY